jgi:8-oxo-dGTP pyrophosphatase MutT (NUDIX family)
MADLGISLARRALIRTALDTLAQAAPAEDGRSGTLVLLELAGDAEDAYLAALLDFLAYLGVIRLSAARSTAAVTSAQAGYLLRLLRALIDSDAPLIADWSREGVTHSAGQAQDRPAPHANTFFSGVNLLAALELHRLYSTPGAAPLREVSAAAGLVVRRDPLGRRAYLLARDEADGVWQLLGGRFEQRDGELRATLLRELAEELACEPLAEPGDVVLHELGQPFYETRVSPTYGLLTQTRFQLYMVRFTNRWPPLHSGLRWVCESELLDGRTFDGQRVDVTPLLRLLKRLDISLEALTTSI